MMKHVFIFAAVTLGVLQADKTPSTNADFLPYFPFFPFGKDFDYVLTDPPNYVFAEGDEDYGVFDHFLQKDLPLFHNPHTRWMYVGVDGYVSFEEPWFATVAQKFPHTSPGFSLFQTDLIFTNAKDSHLSFKEYTEKDKAIMEHAQFEMKEFGKQKDFVPNHVIAITWHKAHKKNDLGRVTFQLVLVSDGFNTFAIFNYEDIFLKNLRKNFCPVSIGWQETPTMFVEHANSQLKRGFPYQPIKMSRGSNIGFPGKWIYHVFQSKIIDNSKPTPPPPTGTAKPLPASCPGPNFCVNKRVVLNSWPGHPGFFVVCPPNGVPVCMACPEKTVFSTQCRTCVHPEQFKLHQRIVCPKPRKDLYKPVSQTGNCNHQDAKRHCNMKQKQIHGDKQITLFQGRFRNHNDLSGRTFYLCVGVYGSFCMPCPAGTVFRHFHNNMANGHCVIKEQATDIVW